MRRKMACATVLTVCFALVFAPAMSADGSARGRGKTTPISQAAGSDDASVTETSAEVSHEILGIRQAPSTAFEKAQMLVGVANGQQGDSAIATLNQVLDLQLESTPENDKLLSEVNRRLGDLYQGTAIKQVHYYGMALQLTSDPGERAALETSIANAGGDVFDIAFNGAGQASRPRTIGVADSCDTAIAVSIPYDSGYTLFIDNTMFVDSDFFSFDVAGPDGVFLSIETLTDEPGTFNDDTDLTLWTGCTGGFPVTELGFNDDGGVDFMSLLNTGCLAPGTYYVEIGGWADIGNADNFALTITQTGTCTVPQPDGYEADNTRGTASAIGLPTSIPQGANGWGRAHKEIQAHSFVPAGDRDWVNFNITRYELVRMGTAIQFPTKWNDLTQVNAGLDNDTVIKVLYDEMPWYGGRCNTGAPFTTVCVTDDDCGPPVLPGFPPCIPYYNFGGLPPGFYNNDINVDAGGIAGALAYNDDVGGGNYGSQLTLCLPPKSYVTPWLTESDSFNLRAEPYSAADQFNYELRVKNEIRCAFNDEPNGSFATAMPIVLGNSAYGIYDSGIFGPDTGDNDLFSFDVESDKAITLGTDGYDSFDVDTYIELYVGPDDDGLFYYTGVADDDGGLNWLSLISGLIVPPASELLGNATADADYFLNVTSVYLNPNFPYTLNTAAAEPPKLESEPNNTIATADVVELGDTISATLSPSCDYDVYKLSISGANTFVTFDILGSFDTSMELVDCPTDTRMACDDDGGPGLASKIDGCLAPGDYCIKVRPYSTVSTGAYGLKVGPGVTGCPNPGVATGDGLYRCTGTQFDTCP